MTSRRSTERLTTLSAVLTGTEGPLRTALNELGKVGIGERILKSAIAATLAWIAASYLPRQSPPFVAALTALYTIDLTLVKSLTAAWQRLAGIALGIVVAFVAAGVFGVHAWSVGLVILISLLIGLRLNLQSDGMAQVAGTALIVLVVRSNTSERSIYSLTFLADTVIGTSIGLLVNALVAPPNPLPRARTALGIVVNRLIAVLEQLSAMVVDGISADEALELEKASARIRSDLEEVETALANAAESMQFNLIAVRKQAELNHFTSIERRMEPIIEALHQMTRALGGAANESWMRSGPLTEAIADLISAAIYVVVGQGEVDSEDRADPATVEELKQRMADLETIADHDLVMIGGVRWTVLGQVIASCQDLGQSVLALNRG
ncbi:MAG TPA: aromatic acid exporter family protein [Thermomicrobiales bacterium]|nr:aromatic acid exporter family protein [Thermomicrobiales bacterium]